MKPEEAFVLEALSKHFGGQFYEGEDPPDGYIDVGSKRVAVEVTMLVEQVRDQKGDTYSRLKDNASARTLSEGVEREIINEIPDGLHVFLAIRTPLKQMKKCMPVLVAVIKKCLAKTNI